MKINKIKMLISSILIIIPAVITAIFSKQLDGMIAVHFGLDGKADGYASPIYFVIFFPLLLIALQWLCVLITLKTNDKIDQSKKVTEIIYWICPVLSIYVSIMMLSLSLGYELNIFALSCVLFGLLFIIIGNYMPKCKQNSTMGIKIRWTLTNEENWNLTHRFAGKVWFIGGVILLICGFLPAKICAIAFLIILFTMIILPFSYSYFNYRTQIKEGRSTEEDFKFPKRSKIQTAIASSVITLILISVTIIMFVGEVKIVCNGSDILIDSTFYPDVTIDIDNIKEVTFTDDLEAHRISGFGSPRLSLGMFKSKELGNINCYCYTQNKSAVIIKTKSDALIVVNQADNKQTKELYNNITELIGGAE